MPSTPGSFTKNLGFGSDYSKLQQAIRNGFRNTTRPIKRKDWLRNTALPGNGLAALNFFLHSKVREDSDYVLVDQLVSHALRSPYDTTFQRLGIFSLHLARSGTWRRTRWPDGRVAGWSNKFVREVAWQDGRWQRCVFHPTFVDDFIERSVTGLPETKIKMRNNYLHLLAISGVIEDDPIELEPALWGQDGCKLFWDRLVYQGTLHSNASISALLKAFLDEEIYKLMSTSKDQGLEIARQAADEYLLAGGVNRFIN